MRRDRAERLRSLENARRRGLAWGVHAFTAWALTAPLLLAAIYLPLRPIFRRWATSGTSDRDRSTKPTP